MTHRQTCLCNYVVGCCCLSPVVAVHECLAQHAVRSKWQNSNDRASECALFATASPKDVRLHKALQHRTAVVVPCQQEQSLCYIKTADHNNNNNSSSNNDISTIRIPKIVVAITVFQH